MGKVFLVHRDSLIKKEININIEVKLKLEAREADEVLILQDTIIDEIDEDVNLFRKEILIGENLSTFKDIKFCIAKNDENICIGYGIGYEDFENSNYYYLETIGVHPEYRGKGIGTAIKLKLVDSAFKNPKVIFVKAVTQESNKPTLKINENIGFKTVDAFSEYFT